MPMRLKRFISILLILISIFSSKSSRDLASDPSLYLQRIEFTVGGYVAPQTIVLALSEDFEQVHAQIQCGGWDITTTLPVSLLQDVQVLLETWDVQAWDGFQGSSADILDGEMFGLKVAYKDGTTLEAHGSNHFPPHYDKVRDGLFTLIAPTLEAYEKEHNTDE